LPSPTTKDNFQIVDLTRTFAIVVVMALHLKPTLYLSKEPWFQAFWQAFQQNGIYGVFIFFVVSGFLITRVLAARSPSLFNARFSVFYGQRIGRIFPLYFLVVLAGLAALFFANDSSHRFLYCFGDPQVLAYPLFFLTLFTFNFNWWSAVSGVHLAVFFSVLWSLSVEEQFYLIYPWLLTKLGNVRNLLVCLGLMVGVAVGWRWGIYQFGQNDFGLSTRFTFGVLDAFAAGIFLYAASLRWDPWLRSRKGVSGLISLAGLLLGLAVYFGPFALEGKSLVLGPTLLALGVFGFLLGGRHLPFFESPALRWLSWPGKYCYGNYLFHGAVLYFIHPYIVRLHTAFAFVVFVAVTTIFAALSYHFYEMPMNRWIRNSFSAKP